MADGITVTWTGTKELRAKLLQAGAQAVPIIAGAATEIGEEVMRESKKQVPVLTGALKNSGRVLMGYGGVTRYGSMGASGRSWTMTGQAAAGIQHVGGANDVTVTLAYGGPAIPYAWFVHEITRYHHKAGTKAHYLRDPVMARRARFGPQMAVKVRGRLERVFAK